MKQELTLALERPGNVLVPVMTVQVDLNHLTGFLDALLEFSRYVPFRALLDGQVVTSYSLNHRGMSIKGQPLEVR